MTNFSNWVWPRDLQKTWLNRLFSRVISIFNRQFLLKYIFDNIFTFLSKMKRFKIIFQERWNDANRILSCKKYGMTWESFKSEWVNLACKIICNFYIVFYFWNRVCEFYCCNYSTTISWSHGTILIRQKPESKQIRTETLKNNNLYNAVQKKQLIIFSS